MVDRLTKSLKKLSTKDNLVADHIIEKLLSVNFEGLNIAKLREYKNLVRTRKGRLRVIYRYDGKKVTILDVDLRSDRTYKKY